MLSGIALIVSLSILIFLIIIDFTVLLLSLIKWWNVPISFNNEGIVYKKNILLKWSDVTIIEKKQKWGSKYGPLYTRMIITFLDGTIVSFEPNSLIDNDINKCCPNITFLTKYNKAKECANVKY